MYMFPLKTPSQTARPCPAVEAHEKLAGIEPTTIHVLPVLLS
jgi:hypothetical protein